MMPLDKQRPSVSRGTTWTRTADADEEEPSIAEPERIVPSLCCTRRNGAREEERAPPKRDGERERERRGCWIVSKKFRRALSPKQIARVRRTERTSLSFPRFRRNCDDRAPGCVRTGPTAPSRRCHGRVVAAKKYDDNSPLVSLAHLARRRCKMRGTTDAGRTTSFAASRIAYPRRESTSYRAGINRSPTLNHARGAPLIWVAG